MSEARARARSGFTLLELMLSVALVSIVATKGVMVMNQTLSATNSDAAESVLEDQAQTLIRRIALAVMGSDRDSLTPTSLAPLCSDEIRYRIHLGLQDGEVVWGDPEEIQLSDDEAEIWWSRNPEAANEMRVVWTKLVAPYLEGELPNGMDDNGNGLIDEKGLSFVVDRNAVTVRLTLDRRDSEGRAVVKTVETVVTCRNVPEDDE